MPPIRILPERGCVEDQPQRVDARTTAGLWRFAAAGRDDTAALRAKAGIARSMCVLHLTWLTVLTACVLAGCESTTPASRGSKPFLPPSVPANTMGLSSEELHQATQLYTVKCAKCHKFYNPADYNDPEWRTWMTKMSKKARLKPEQEKLLSRYLEVFRAKETR